jgi:hypothetical protein
MPIAREQSRVPGEDGMMGPDHTYNLHDMLMICHLELIIVLATTQQIVPYTLIYSFVMFACVV